MKEETTEEHLEFPNSGPGQDFQGQAHCGPTAAPWPEVYPFLPVFPWKGSSHNLGFERKQDCP